jgi:DNA mismatch repair protein MSH6
VLLLRANKFTVCSQIGGYVPAESLRMTPVDRIFTRVGARDRIVSGQSTFMVELAETAAMLRYVCPTVVIFIVCCLLSDIYQC